MNALEGRPRPRNDGTLNHEVACAGEGRRGSNRAGGVRVMTLKPTVFRLAPARWQSCHSMAGVV